MANFTIKNIKIILYITLKNEIFLKNKGINKHYGN